MLAGSGKYQRVIPIKRDQTVFHRVRWSQVRCRFQRRLVFDNPNFEIVVTIISRARTFGSIERVSLINGYFEKHSISYVILVDRPAKCCLSYRSRVLRLQ